MGAGDVASADLIRLAYKGILRKPAWEEMLVLACRVFRAQDAYFARIPINPPGPRMVLTHGVDPKVVEAYREVWVAPPNNPTLTPLYKATYRGVLEPKDVVPKAEFERTEFYDVCRKPRHVEAELGCGDVGGQGQIRFFTVNRTTGDPPFGDRERRLMTLLNPHLMRALSLDAALSTERGGAAWMTCAIEGLDDPVIRRDPDGRLRPLNTAGEDLLRSEGFGTWDGDGLVPRDPRSPLRNGAPSRPSGKAGLERSFRTGRVWRVFSSPCFEGDRFVGEVLRLRLVPGPMSRAAPEAQPLTPQENSVGTLLCEGLASSEICARLDISSNTLNTHIRHLFEKTGCHSRAQLVVYLGLSSRQQGGAGDATGGNGYRD